MTVIKTKPSNCWVTTSPAAFTVAESTALTKQAHACPASGAGKASSVREPFRTRWFATFAEMMNFRLPEGAAPDSQPMLKAWTGKEKKGREWLVLQNAHNNLSITDGQWKYIRPGKGPAVNKFVNIELGNSMEPQLYNITKDPSEKNNVADKNPDLVKKMAAKLEYLVDNRYGQPL